MIYREATIDDISQIQVVRNAVEENRLSDPALVTDDNCAIYMTVRGKAWVCEIDKVIEAFAYIDMQENNVWALFVTPAYAKKGIGKKLHTLMIDLYFKNSSEKIWLSTAPGTRAEIFYEKHGWKKVGMHGREIKFEMDIETWQINSSEKNLS